MLSNMIYQVKITLFKLKLSLDTILPYKKITICKEGNDVK